MNYYSIDRSPCLQHHGIKGMRWGVRNYQGYDGRRLLGGPVYESSSNSNGNKGPFERHEGYKTIDDIPKASRSNGEDGSEADFRKALEKERNKQSDKFKQNASDFTRNSTDATNELSKLLKKEKRSRKKIDMSTMSDDELKNRINRIRLEQSYYDLVNPPTVSKGRRIAGDFLDTTTSMLKISGSAAAAGVALYKMRYWL